MPRPVLRPCQGVPVLFRLADALQRDQVPREIDTERVATAAGDEGDEQTFADMVVDGAPAVRAAVDNLSDADDRLIDALQHPLDIGIVIPNLRKDRVRRRDHYGHQLAWVEDGGPLI